ncbi:CHAT domain-containing protein [Roseofilum capinflatum]|uniref:CHAT domain-containing protein n=1 Tax=Roseofilum capinflatum BLCC-M114 TaxID=3022440 RepID=A0ABT7B9Y7_9CYAN|nr:CHAT domain-containing protein [Roseofilum capinflatum]MDJ1175967.1 CHAT domain-containing protein [Roseofilum capinflatum BLCC-M114]
MAVTRKWVIFEFGEGSFETGFPVTVRIGTDGIEGSNRIPNGWLPPAPKGLTESSLGQWKQNFEEWIQYFASRSIKLPAAQVNQVGISFPRQTEELEKKVQEWLKHQHKDWQKIISALSLELNRQDRVRVIIQTDNDSLKQLPWQVWELFSDSDKLSKTEFVFSPSQQTAVGLNLDSRKLFQVKILVILGEPLEKETISKIDYQSDLDAISKLDADIEFLAQPTRQILVDKLWEKHWQIIFHSGHSGSERDTNKGYLLLKRNQNGSEETISISNLKESLVEAIANGLQLAIFNSCDGLGIANQLQELSLPQVIVMRNKVPDTVAQDFLQDFLKAFAGGEGDRSLHDALRETRKKLKDNYDDSYPGMSWNPVIFQQHPDTRPLLWREFLKVSKKADQAKNSDKYNKWQCVDIVESNLRSYEAYDLCRCVAVNPVNDRIIVTTFGSILKMWKIEEDKDSHYQLIFQKSLSVDLGKCYDISINPNGRQIASCDLGTQVKIWSLQTGELLNALGNRRFAILGETTDDILNIASNFLPISTDFVYKQASRTNVAGHSDDVMCVKFSPNGEFIISGSIDKTIKVWEVQTGQIIHTLSSSHDNALLAINTDGRTVASMCDNKIDIWDLHTGKIKRTLFGYDAIIRSLAFSHDGNLLASGTYEGRLNIWNWKAGQLLHSLSAECNNVSCLTFSPDNQILASGCSDSTIKLWNPIDGTLIQMLDTPETDGCYLRGIYSIVFACDGKVIVSSCADKSEIKVWQKLK